MSWRLLSMCLVMTGCQVVFPFDPTCVPRITDDEDGDGIPDDCDVCPGEAGSNLDEDGDGVGDACDPDPEVACHTRVKFDGFNDDAATEPVGAGFAISEGALRKQVFEKQLTSYPEVHADVTVRTSVEVTGFAPALPGTLPLAEIGSGTVVSGVNTEQGVSCRLTRLPGGDIEAGLFDLTNDVAFDTTSYTHNGVGDAVGEVRFELLNTEKSAGCKLTGLAPGGSGEVPPVVVSSPMTAGKVMVKSAESALVVRWIEVIAHVDCP